MRKRKKEEKDEKNRSGITDEEGSIFLTSPARDSFGVLSYLTMCSFGIPK